MKKKANDVQIAADVARELLSLLVTTSRKRRLSGRQCALMQKYAQYLERGLNKGSRRSVALSQNLVAGLLRCLILVYDRRHEIRRVAESVFGWLG